MSLDGQGTKWHRKNAQNFNRLSRVHERYRRQTDGRATTYSERGEFTFAKNLKQNIACFIDTVCRTLMDIF